MGLPLKQLEAEALELPLSERAQLARRLIISLDEDAGEEPDAVERAWEEEIRRRLEEVDAGTAELVTADEVFAELRARTRR